jgi:hypothetical protein
MVKKILVKELVPFIMALRADGLNVTRAELFPAEWRGYYTLAISAEWKDLTGIRRHRVLNQKKLDVLSLESNKLILNTYTYNSPEAIEAEMHLLTQYQTPVGGDVVYG